MYRFKIKMLFFTIMIFSFTLCSKCKAIDYSKPYNSTKNYIFSLNDINSNIINELYFNDDIEIPSNYTLSDKIDIVVENQRNLGLCDLFSTLKCAETNYALNNNEYIDLSERYLDYMTSKYFYGTRNPGILGSTEGDGAHYHEIGSFMEAIGAANVEQVPYKNYTDSEIQNLKNIIPVVRATGFVEFPGFYELQNEDQKNLLMNIIKKHIMKYGSLRVSINAPVGEVVNYDTYSVYYREGVSEPKGGHAVSIVGWDDNYPKENFNIEPKKDGAFLCLNSWGTEWGNNGYFWLSYEDDNIVQPSGFLGTKKINQLNEYTNAVKLFNNTGRSITDSPFIGIKLKKKYNNEYFSHLTLNMYSIDNKNNIIYNSKKVHFFLNPIDDSFDKDKMVYLESSLPLNTFNLNLMLDKPIKIKGNNYSVVIQFDEDLGNIFIGDTDNSELDTTTYISKGFDDTWQKNNVNLPIFVYTINKKESNVTLKSAPIKTTYVKGEKLNLDGCKGLIEYEDGETEEIEFNEQNTIVSDYNPNLLGIQQITLNYKGFELNFNIIIKNDIKSIEIKNKPTKLTYAKDDLLDLTGGILTVNYEDDTTLDIDMKSSNISSTGFNSKKLGEQIITIKYGDYTTSYRVNIKNDINSIKIGKMPLKTTYIKGENLDLSGGTLIAKYDDGSESNIDMTSNDVTYSNYDCNKINEQEVLIKYKNFIATLKVIIKNDIKSISVKKMPDKLLYNFGESLQLDGGIITVEYDDGSFSNIQMNSNKIIIAEYDLNIIGKQTIKLEYLDKKVSFDINIKENHIDVNNNNKTVNKTKTKTKKYSIYMIIITLIGIILGLIFLKITIS